MALPGFNAEATLYQTRVHYQTFGCFDQIEETSLSTQQIFPAEFPRKVCDSSALWKCRQDRAEDAVLCLVACGPTNRRCIAFCLTDYFRKLDLCIRDYGCPGFTVCRDNLCSCGLFATECGTVCCTRE